MSEHIVPKFIVKKAPHDVSAQLRVQQYANGYAVKTGSLPIHYSTIEEAAEAVKRGLIKAFCEEQTSSSCKSS